MATIHIGGDPENYMQAPEMNVSDGSGGPGGFIASLLDAIGINRQVAKGPKPGKDATSDIKPKSKIADVKTPTTMFPALNQAESALGNPMQYMRPIPSHIQIVDPNDFLR